VIRDSSEAKNETWDTNESSLVLLIVKSTLTNHESRVTPSAPCNAVSTQPLPTCTRGTTQCLSAKLKNRLLRLASQHARGALWMLASAVTFTLMTTLVKYLGEDYPAALQPFIARRRRLSC